MQRLYDGKGDVVIEKNIAPRNYSIRYLFIVIASFAVGIRLLISDFPIPVRSIGFATCCYWTSKGIFAISAQLPPRIREAVFVFGLPIYLCAVVGVVFGVLGTGLLMTLGFSR